MTVPPAEPREWSPIRWGVTIAVVFGLQVGVIVWWKDQTRHTPRQPAPAPVFHLSGSRSRELLALEDPTRFALPHPEGFSGKAWIHYDWRPPSYSEADEPETEPWLKLPVARLGKTFEEFVRTNPPPSFATLAEVEPALAAPRIELAPPASGPSRLQLGGDLAGRPLLGQPPLPAWTNTDLLTNTVVQLVVDGSGRVLSAVLLPPGSGYEPANQFALNLGRNARFEPLPGNAGGPASQPSGLSVGTLAFEWQTILVPATNALAGIP